MPRAVLDACILYPPGLRNLFMWLAVEGLYLPLWTQEIHEEWIDNVLEEDARKNEPPGLSRDKLERTRQLMDENASQSLVTGYEHWIPQLSLLDPKDRHVLAAAIESGASLIITYDRHFIPEALTPHGIKAIEPDAFLCNLFDRDPGLFMKAVDSLLSSLMNPPMSLEQLCQGYLKHRLTQTVTRMRAYRR